MHSPTGNITKALQVLAKFEELVHAEYVHLDIAGKQVLLNPGILPATTEERRIWMKEAFLYFKFKAANEFDETCETLAFSSASDGKVIERFTMAELQNAKGTVVS